MDCMTPQGGCRDFFAMHALMWVNDASPAGEENR